MGGSGGTVVGNSPRLVVEEDESRVDALGPGRTLSEYGGKGREIGKFRSMTFDRHPIGNLPKEIKVNTRVNIVLVIGYVESVSAWVKVRI